jgi:hypothetical protein
MEERNMIDKRDWEWYGSVGHFICGRWCRFHLLTRVGGYIVSTIGEYLHPSRGKGNEMAEEEYLAKNGFDDIGCGRKYETLVFRFGKPCDEKECGKCGMPTPSDWTEIGGGSYNDAGSATRGHMKLCEKYAAMKPEGVKSGRTG